MLHNKAYPAVCIAKGFVGVNQVLLGCLHPELRQVSIPNNIHAHALLLLLLQVIEELQRVLKELPLDPAVSQQQSSGGCCSMQ
jgi:hypothetical protein